MKTLTLILLAAFFLPLSAGAQSAQSEKSFQKDISRTVTLDYLLSLPEGYDAEKDKRWPLLLFLHGAGERGDDLEVVKKHGPPKLIEAGKSGSSVTQDFIVVSPQCPEDRWWDHEALYALLETIEEDYRVDPGRIYVTGLSMGGFGTWEMAGRYPEKFAAAAPICGGGFWILARRLADLPIWAFHGAKDPTVPLSESERMVDAIQKRGGGENVKLTVYPEAAHDSWTETYDNPALYEWFLSHSRAK